MNKRFQDQFPGDGLWIFFDINTGPESTHGFPPGTIKAIIQKAQALSRLAGDWGMPHIIIQKEDKLPLKIFSLSYAPFIPVRSENLPFILDFLPNSQSKPFDPRIGGRTNGWYSSFANATSETMVRILTQKPYQSIIFGFDQTGFLEKFGDFLSTLGITTWIIEDLVRSGSRVILPKRENNVQSDDILKIYQHLSRNLDISNAL